MAAQGAVGSSPQSPPVATHEGVHLGMAVTVIQHLQESGTHMQDPKTWVSELHKMKPWRDEGCQSYPAL